MNTTIVPKIKLPAIGSRLPNGSWVLAARQGRFADQGVVLGFHGGAGAPHPFATWVIGPTYVASHGEYCRTLYEALGSYESRP